MTSVASGSAEQWLDLLPEEICERIACHLSQGRPTTCLLALGVTSQKQRAAACAVIGGELNVQNSFEFTAWAKLFQDEVVGLDISFSNLANPTNVVRPREPSAGTSALFHLLRSPVLHRLCTMNDPAVLRVIAESSSLCSLEITFVDPNGLDALFACLESLQLSDLAIRCRMPLESSTCPLAPASRGATLRRLAPVCSKLFSLALACTCETGEEEPDWCAPLWEILPQLPDLRETKFIGGALPDRVAPLLRRLDNVSILNGPLADRLALEIGTPVIQLVCTGITFSSEKVETLVSCPRLQKLSLVLECGAEEALLNILRRLPLIEGLDLSWERAKTCLHNSPGHYGRCFHSPKPGVVLRLVRRAPRLARLYLTDVRLDSSEVRDILKVLGGRLLALRIDVLDHMDAPVNRLEMVLCFLGTFNEGVEELEINGLSRNQLMLEGVDPVETGQSLLRLLKRLQQKAPKLSATVLEYVIANCMNQTG